MGGCSTVGLLFLLPSQPCLATHQSTTGWPFWDALVGGGGIKEGQWPFLHPRCSGAGEAGYGSWKLGWVPLISRTGPGLFL